MDRPATTVHELDLRVAKVNAEQGERIAALAERLVALGNVIAGVVEVLGIDDKRLRRLEAMLRHAEDDAEAARRHADGRR